MRISPTKIQRMREADLLHTELRDLDLPWPATFDRRLRRLYRDLDQAGIYHLRPQAYLSDEWFCPAESTWIAIPFYLAHPRLAKFEDKFRRRPEGITPKWFMQLLRHEAGHAFDHAYGVSDTKEWRDIFGDKSVRYNTERYQYDPHSDAFVQHLPDHYAQSHPEEDYAETFATYITPGLNWQGTYRDCPQALRKLRYIGKLISRFGDVIPHPQASEPTAVHHRLRRTLASHYRLLH